MRDYVACKEITRAPEGSEGTEDDLVDLLTSTPAEDALPDADSRAPRTDLQIKRQTMITKRPRGRPIGPLKVVYHRRVLPELVPLLDALTGGPWKITRHPEAFEVYAMSDAQKAIVAPTANLARMHYSAARRLWAAFLKTA